MKKNEIRTDEEATLTTPEDASVLDHCRPTGGTAFALAKSEIGKVFC